MIDLKGKWRRVHLVGMGGAGMSAIAHVLLQGGVVVSGSDLRESAALSALRSLGVRADVGHRAHQAEGADVVIASAAVGPENPELELARAQGIPIMLRGQALASIVEGLRTVAVSGTHGKTTTSGMVATVALHAGLDPTYLLGADLTGLGPGGRLGNGDVAIVEADEAYRSFLWLEPSTALVTNIDRDHLEHYGSWEALNDAFRLFMSRSASGSVVCADDAHAMAVAESLNPVTYGFDPHAQFRGELIEADAEGSTFDLIVRGEVVARVRLPVAGRHNILNALGATAACVELGIDLQEIVEGLGQFRGASRRFEYRGRFRGADLVDDYAHHPAEIEATLSAARFGPWKRVVAVFQPHLYSRTQSLWREFGTALAMADLIVVTDVYGAREQPVPGVTGKLIVDSVCESAPGRPVAYLPRLNDAARYLQDVLRPEDLVLSLGAGDITTLYDRLSGEVPARG
ncbi:MAG TPA: UDP-N-acetylmuramate--L-alanine ligase [Actinomycetota bacterium]|nr:UDP-N-acetylmuramate--L-alanine ligase [Actinomycetota bacterium]